MKDFLVRITSKDQLINGIKSLNEIGALGSEISYGTYLPDSYVVSDIINSNINIWSTPKDPEDICAFCIGIDAREDINKRFPKLFGKNHIHVSLATLYDVKAGDIPKKKIPYCDLINETIKLIS